MKKTFILVASILSALNLAACSFVNNEKFFYKRSLEEMFKRIDADENGIISKDEFMIHNAEMKKKRKECRENAGKRKGAHKGKKLSAEERFEKIDANNVNGITLEEWKKHLDNVKFKRKAPSW
jgi:hypothetical protein